MFLERIRNKKGSATITAITIMFIIGNLFIIGGMWLKMNNTTVVDRSEKIYIKALTDNSEIKGEIDGALTFVEGEISQEIFYRVELFNPETKLSRGFKFSNSEIDKYEDLEKDEMPYILLEIEEYQYKNEDFFVMQHKIPKIYKGFLPKNLKGRIKHAEIHLPENSIEQYVEIDTK